MRRSAIGEAEDWRPAQRKDLHTFALHPHYATPLIELVDEPMEVDQQNVRIVVLARGSVQGGVTTAKKRLIITIQESQK